MPILRPVRRLLIVLSLLGHRPGDFRIERPGFSLYAPLGSGLAVSVVLTLIAWFLRR
jgi:hypothetical protein